MIPFDLSPVRTTHHPPAIPGHLDCPCPVPAALQPRLRACESTDHASAQAMISAILRWFHNRVGPPLSSHLPNSVPSVCPRPTTPPLMSYPCPMCVYLASLSLSLSFRLLFSPSPLVTLVFLSMGCNEAASPLFLRLISRKQHQHTSEGPHIPLPSLCHRQGCTQHADHLLCVLCGDTTS